MYVSEICAEGILCLFPGDKKKNVESRSKLTFFFQMSAILKFDFHKRKLLHFSEENYLSYTNVAIISSLTQG